MNRSIDQSPLSREILELVGDDVVRLTDARGISIFVRAGRAWITGNGDSGSIVIGAGETFEVDRLGLALVSPIDGATVVISALPDRARTSRIERVDRDGQRHPVLCGRPRTVPTGASPIAPAL